MCHPAYTMLLCICKTYKSYYKVHTFYVGGLSTFAEIRQADKVAL